VRRLLVCAALAFLTACGVSSHFAVRVAAYAEDQALCVKEAQSKEDSQYCRAQVKTVWAPLLAADAGPFPRPDAAPTPKDAGHE